MPKNSSTTVLQRWRAMDHQLAHLWFGVAAFAGAWHVSEKTVRRDMEVFRSLKQRIVRKYNSDCREYYYQYDRGVKPLFSANCEPTAHR
jgi:hypothetical protein